MKYVSLQDDNIVPIIALNKHHFGVNFSVVPIKLCVVLKELKVGVNYKQAYDNHTSSESI